ncbi:MAG: hypothetical protein ACKO8I_05325 [Cyanobacteriota bacterium]
MNLTDTMIGGVVFALASTSSLQIHRSSLEASAGQELRRDRDAASDRLLVALQRELQRQGALLPPDYPLPPCSDGVTALSQQLPTQLGAALAAAQQAGVTLDLSASGELLSATVRAPQLPERRRWYSPAAHGLCGTPAEQAAPEA